MERLKECLESETGITRIEKSKEYIMANWTEARLRLCRKEGVTGCSAGMGKMAELRAYYYNKGDMLELVRCQKRIWPKTTGCEEVVLSCAELLRQESKHRQNLGALADKKTYSIP